MTSCIGDDVTYTCNVDSTVHIWEFGGLIGTVAIGASLNDPASIGAFTLQRVSGTSTSAIVSTLSVTTFAGLNGTLISCRDGTVIPEDAESQTTIAFVLGEIYVQRLGNSLRGNPKHTQTCINCNLMYE